MSAPDLRLAALTDWVTRELAHDVRGVEVASADASFRRYFRVHLRDGASLIVMDAPPAQEDIGPYLHVGALLAQTGVHVPAVYAVDRERGFVLLEDLGTTSYLSALQDAGRAEALYGEALVALARLQVRPRVAARTSTLRRGGAAARARAHAGMVLRSASAASGERG